MRHRVLSRASTGPVRGTAACMRDMGHEISAGLDRYVPSGESRLAHGLPTRPLSDSVACVCLSSVYHLAYIARVSYSLAGLTCYFTVDRTVQYRTV